MKLLMVVILYLIGAIVCGVWIYGRHEMDTFIKDCLEDKDLQMLPEKVVKALVPFSISLVCLIWPAVFIGQIVDDIKSG